MDGMILPGKDQMESEEGLWQEAAKRMHEHYGEKPPLAVLSRFEAERQLFSGTGLIEHYALINKLYDSGIVCGDLSSIQITFTGWLIGACDLNPLPPHTVCPECKKVIFHPEVKDGWDLPDEVCDCGEELCCDGHDIPLYFMQRRYIHLNRKENIAVVHDGLEELKRIVEKQYMHRWHLVEYPDAETQLLMEIFEDFDRRSFALVPTESGITDVGKEEYQQEPCRNLLNQSVASIIHFDILEANEVSKRENAEREPTVNDDDLFTPQTLSYAWGSKRILSISYEIPEERLSHQQARDLFDPPDIEEDISPYLPDRPCFSDFVKLKGIHTAARIWLKMLGLWVRDKTVPIESIPMSQEDIYDFILQHLSKYSVHDTGIADHIFACISRMKPMENTTQLLQRGLPEWFIEFIMHEIYSQDISDKQSLVYQAVDALRNANRQRLLGEPIGPNVKRIHYVKQSPDVTE